METAEIKMIIEALLFAADQPVNDIIIKSILGEVSQGQDIEALVKEIGGDYAQRNGPIELRFVAGGWQLATRKEFGSWVRRLYREKTTLRLSNSALETLSVVAYKQPITRSEIEEIRGVEVSGVLETLLERKLVRVVGRKEALGRPLLYGTTQEFLRHFGLGHLSELPSLEEVTQQEESAQENTPELPFVESAPGAGEAAEGEATEGETLPPENGETAGEQEQSS
ncbi:MAG: SMC-Scp complex subunit ScpB [Endomicrobiales bacterium]